MPSRPGHDEVLQDDGGAKLGSQSDSLSGIRAVVEVEVGLIRQTAADGFHDEDLVIHQQHHDALSRRPLQRR